jgi:hypothetical protein
MKEQKHPGMSNVLFSTNCYWRDIGYLAEGGFVYKALLNDYRFGARWMIINNVEDPLAAMRAFGPVADEVLVMDDVADKSLKHFGFPSGIFVDGNTNVDGWIYSIDSLIELARAKDFDYICHYCGDVELYKKADWITEGIRKIEQEGYAGARPRLPRYEMQVPGEQELTETDIFSDHVYLIPVKPFHDYLADIFSLTEPSCDDIHVEYGGESFERKMTRYLKATNQKLAIIQNAEECPSAI